MLLNLLLVLPCLAGDLEVGDLGPGDAVDPRIDPEDVSPAPDHHEDPIINGIPAAKADYPMAGGLIIGGRFVKGLSWLDFQILTCTGTLIAPDVVLTAAHCIDLVFTEPELQDADLENPYFAFTGEPDLTDYLEGDPDVTLPSDAVLAWDWVPHEEWDRMNVHYERLWETDDIGLIFLEEPITDVDPAVLPTREEADLLAVDDALEVVGWGMRDASDEDVTGEKYMGDSYISDIATWEFRVGLVEADVRKCHGDSGGPSFTRVDTESTTDMRLVGVTSHAWDATDCEEVGGVDTRADYYLEWIDGHMRSRCDDGTRVWCDEPGVLPPPMPKEEKRACGCSGVGPAWAGGAWVGLFALWGRRRRR